MTPSPPPPPSPSQHATVHAYASNGLEILQAASDAAQAIQNPQALQNAAAAAAEVVVQPAIDEDAAAAAAAAAAHQMTGSTPPPAPHPLPASPPHQQQQQQQLQPHHQHPQHLMPGPGGVMRDPTINPKLTRLRRACDMCSMRKVKCDDTDVPCRPCRELGVDCTYERETKRRGPPNKHAEAAKAAKRARVDFGAAAAAAAAAAVASAATGALPASPSPHNAAKTLINISSDGLLDAEAIAPLPVLELLVDDFFTYLHPLAPFPHEPTFRQSFANREDRSRPDFLGLLASMIAALVASFPRSAREHLKSQHGAHLFPKPVVMADRCRDIALLTRGSKWVLKQPKTLDDAATSYFLGLACGYCDQWNASRHFMAETLTLIRELGFARPKHPGDLPTFGNDPYSADPLPFNHVKDQIGKRLFWCLLLGVRSFSQLGASHTPTDLVIAPSTPNLPYPAYPENVDDICVLANEIIHQAEGSVTLLTGFRFAIDIYTTMNGVVSLELAYGMSTLPWPDQRLLLRDGLVAAKSIVDNLPPELQLGNLGDDANSLAGLDEAGLQYVPPVWPQAQPPHDLRSVIKAQPLQRRQLQYEMQKANIFVSQLATRSYFVDLFFTLRDVHLSELQQQQQQQGGGDEVEAQLEEIKALQDVDDKDILDLMCAERELLVQNLLTILGSVSQRNLEPNGGSLINKIRQVALTLLNDAPERKGPFAVKAEEALSQLIEVLAKLDKSGSAAGSGRAADPSQMMTVEDEDEELRHWADLRDFQLRYAANGGFGDDL
ncbi:fungal zn(2)-Cys(6) binuclear cluster domain-containing protein [Hirsutella rhossiliensis]|uniref:Fungal zn(2)-Cys(6) binuclear cluster domain-containing protein n=1 Tax=Hirsutella rhossiliensis TaxID=111463 RepID=A0A9P8MR24_9HYPO|nr:fungal zn(2)-Cys(6) binuclear cluster domain-containing protein [Hirsutella rhossiliensis]KAH0960248.1 fungal zn(2)-Cys(6) binuclear cluster domain-containing protein [Hirsutella rhossiliensis]